MSNILDRIVATKWQEIAAAKVRVPEVELLARLRDRPPCAGFAAKLRKQGGVRVIAEVKKASPSAGVIRADFDPVRIAQIYEANGADCLSVLTDETYFQGHLDYLSAVKNAVAIPILRKDFVLDGYQLLEARAAGADAVLLIAEILPGQRIAELHAEAVAFGLDVLVELHDATELPRVLASGATLVGVNNRDLRTFTTRLEQTLEIAEKIPTDVTLVSESGIRTRADVERLATAGVHAILVGESLMRADDIGAALRALRNA